MNSNSFAFLAGSILGVGLILAGMAQPARVLGFLDISGNWDPRLALVMIGAIGVHGVALKLILRRPHPWFSETFHLPRRTHIDRSLLGGAALFGIGWGLAGICPGPGLVAAGGASRIGLAFVVGMGAGVGLFRALSRLATLRAPAATAQAPQT